MQQKTGRTARLYLLQLLDNVCSSYVPIFAKEFNITNTNLYRQCYFDKISICKWCNGQSRKTIRTS